MRVWSKALVTAAAVIAIWMAGGVLRGEAKAAPADTLSPHPVLRTGAQPRDVDTAKIKSLIDQGRLSDKEAMYYEGLE